MSPYELPYRIIRAAMLSAIAVVAFAAALEYVKGPKAPLPTIERLRHTPATTPTPTPASVAPGKATPKPPRRTPHHRKTAAASTLRTPPPSVEASAANGQRAEARPHATATRPQLAAANTQLAGVAPRLPVRRVGDMEWEMDRHYAIESVEQPSPETAGAMLMPVYENRQPIGLRLRGVRAGSLYRAMGLYSGDVLLAVNGREIDSPNRMLELYQAMRGHERFELELARRGQRRTHVYVLR